MTVMDKLGFKKGTIRFGVLTGMLFLMAGPAFSQINYTMTDRHERLKRQSLREANQVEATAVSDTHLNMDVYTLRKGEAGKAERRGMKHMFKRKQAISPASATDRDKKRFKLFRKKN